MAKTRQQLLDEELARQKQSNIPVMGTQGVAQFNRSARPFANTGLAPLVMNDPDFNKPAPVVMPQGLNSAAPAPTLTQPVPAPVANAPVQSAPLPAAPSFASVNAQADREAQKAAAETNANMIMGKSGLPQGFALGPQGQLIPERQLRAGLQSAVTPMAPVGPDMTNQQAMATAARVGTNVATPMGVFSVPLNTNANFSASGLGGVGVSQAQRAAGEMAQATQAIGATRTLQAATGQGMTHEAQAGRARQLEQDQINQGLASAAQAQQTANNQAKVDAATQQGQNAAMANAQGHIVATGLMAGRDAQGNPLPGANQPANPVKDENGTWMDQNTGKLITSEAVLKRLEGEETRKADIEVARGLPHADDRWAIGRFFGTENPALYGYNPKTGEFRKFGSRAEMDNPKNKDYVPLSPEQQKAYDEGNKGLRSAAPAQQIPLPAGSTASPQVGQVQALIGLQGAGPVNQQGISLQQQGPVTMIFPDGKRKQVPASEMSQWLALGGKVARTQQITGLQSAAQPAMVGQPAGNQYAGAKLNFGSEQEAEAAGLPPGTIITIAGRRARVK